MKVVGRCSLYFVCCLSAILLTGSGKTLNSHRSPSLWEWMLVLTDNQTESSDEDDPDGGVGSLSDVSVLVEVPDSGEGAGHVAHLSGSVGKDNTAG